MKTVEENIVSLEKSLVRILIVKINSSPLQKAKFAFLVAGM